MSKFVIIKYATYFVAYGKLSSEQINTISQHLTRSTTMQTYYSENEYNNTINQLRLDGYTVNVR